MQTFHHRWDYVTWSSAMCFLAHGDSSSVDSACRQDITCSMGSSGRGKQRNSILTPDRQNTKNTLRVRLHLRCSIHDGKTNARQRYPTKDASGLWQTPRKSSFWRSLQETWREPKKHPLDLRLLQTRCCSARGPRRAGQAPRSCGSGAVPCLSSLGCKKLHLWKRLTSGRCWYLNLLRRSVLGHLKQPTSELVTNEKSTLKSSRKSSNVQSEEISCCYF